MCYDYVRESVQDGRFLVASVSACRAVSTASPSMVLTADDISHGSVVWAD